MQGSKSDESVGIRSRQFCTFRICDRLYGVDICDVKEINSNIEIAPIFHAPKEVKGYVNIRGQIYLLLDLRLILGFESKATDEVSRVVLFKTEVGEPCGILVDSIDDIVAVDETRIENRRRQDREIDDADDRRGVDMAEGVCQLEDELLVVMNSRNFLNLVSSRKAQAV